MTVSVADFRTNFPEFADTTNYTSGQIQMFLDLGYVRTSMGSWSSLRDMGVQLLVAHNLFLHRQRTKAAAAGNVPGEATGARSSKSVGPTATSFDTTGSSEKDAGNYNASTYGQQFFELAMIAGAGAQNPGRPSPGVWPRITF